jgi:ribosome-associated protein
MGPIVVMPGVRVPSEALAMRAVRAGGPGGQNVNKVSSKVEVRVDVDKIDGLDAAARERLRASSSTDAQGRVIVTSQRTRDQHLNLEDARQKIRRLVASALERPRTRRATRPTRASVERRLSEKRRRGERKALRSD